MKTLFLTTTIVFASLFSFGQNEKAKTILTSLGEKTKSYKSMSIEFKLTVKGDDLNETQTGKALTKGNSFYYETKESKVYSDGETIWTYIIEDNECYIDDVEDLDGGINPKELMSIWEDNFKYKYIDESQKNGATIHQIKLFPNEPKESKYHTIVLFVNSTKNQLSKVIIKTKDGLTLLFNITKFSPNVEIRDTQLVWNKAKFPGVDEIDNR